MAADAQLGASFIARGDRGELRVTNPVGPHWGASSTHCQLTPTGTTNETVPGETSYTHQLRALVLALRGDRSAYPTDAHDGVIGMRIIDDVYRAAGLPPRGT